MLAENIFTFLIISAIFVIIWVAITNKVYNNENLKISFFKKKISKLL